jgi:predicted RNase H-like HicB family nuclease
MVEYHAAYFKQDNGWYVVEIVDFPGVASQGKTLRSARVMIRDALKLMAQCRFERDFHLPPPNPKAKSSLGKKPDLVETIPLQMRFFTPVVK